MRVHWPEPVSAAVVQVLVVAVAVVEPEPAFPGLGLAPASAEQGFALAVVPELVSVVLSVQGVHHHFLPVEAHIPVLS